MIIRNIETKEEKIEAFNKELLKHTEHLSNGELIRTQKQELEYLEHLEDQKIRQLKEEEAKKKSEVKFTS